LSRLTNRLLDVAPVGAEAEFGEDGGGEGEGGDVLHLVLDEGAEFVGLGEGATAAAQAGFQRLYAATRRGSLPQRYSRKSGR
jgi:hypothetical protein